MDTVSKAARMPRKTTLISRHIISAMRSAFGCAMMRGGAREVVESYCGRSKGDSSVGADKSNEACGEDGSDCGDNGEGGGVTDGLQ